MKFIAIAALAAVAGAVKIQTNSLSLALLKELGRDSLVQVEDDDAPNDEQLEKLTKIGERMGVPLTPEMMQLGGTESITNAMVEIATGQGKTEDEILEAMK